MSPLNYDNLGTLGPVSPTVSIGGKLVLAKELNWYYGQLSMADRIGYCEEIENTVEECTELHGISDETKIIITIPVHILADFDNVYGVISLYANQEGINKKSLVILLDFNWRKNEKGIDEKLAEAYRQLALARKNFPELTIATIEQANHDGIFYVAKEMNDVIMLALRKAIKEKRLSPDADILIIRNDADTIHIHKHYLSSYSKAASDNPKTPIFVGTTWFDIENMYRTPGFAALMYFDRTLTLSSNMMGNVFTAGGNFGYRAQYFAAVSGLGYNCYRNWYHVGSDDVQIGYRLRMAFWEQSKEEHYQICIVIPEAIIDTNCTRLLSVYAEENDLVTIDAYGAKSKRSFVNSPTRPKDTVQFTEKIDDEVSFRQTVKQFELEMDSYLYFYGPENPILKDSLNSLFENNDALQYFTVIQTEGKMRLSFTEEGKNVFRELIRNKFGDGINRSLNDNLYRAIQEGLLVSKQKNNFVDINIYTSCAF